MNATKILEQSLTELGLSPIEVLVWLTTRSLDTVPASVVAREIGKGRITIYKVLERLEEAELVVRLNQEGTAHFSTIPLTELRQILLRKSQAMIGLAVDLHDLISGDEMEAE